MTLAEGSETYLRAVAFSPQEMCTGKTLAWTADIRDWARSYRVVILHVYCARRAPFRRARCEEVWS